MMRLNVEEMNLLYMFDNSSRKAAVQDILDRFPFLENEELKEICQQTVMKLEHMTDEEFDAIDFTIYDEEELDGEMYIRRVYNKLREV